MTNYNRKTYQLEEETIFEDNTAYIRLCHLCEYVLIDTKDKYNGSELSELIMQKEGPLDLIQNQFFEI